MHFLSLPAGGAATAKPNIGQELIKYFVVSVPASCLTLLVTEPSSVDDVIPPQLGREENAKGALRVAPRTRGGTAACSVFTIEPQRIKRLPFRF